ncbi:MULTISPECIES: SpoIIIAH-like family protein [Clostridium]|uniref:SpoIIIAH-like family protein n=1 Tax=Clostridium aquiflavi TaxID=3073603 RepID=A0ABU1EH72_9CLOT|nr:MULTISPECIES: SpoIIIAH-like family protein [unclassified Clostridium]MDR5587304.1 SpoIIIAH-like family protein [Clostridium sp. 5N-1]NFG62173.1 SpoIIIAH-like family protein [Clostridium botulinum]NFQ09587.1 SpoIIIAH-like family protein [Clostridium botulinum]
MKRKQLGIIFTLLALILCVGVLAAKLNKGGLNDPTDLSAVLSTENVGVSEEKGEVAKADDDKATLSQNEYFFQSRSEREQQESATIQSLKALVADENTSKEKKEDANKELTERILRKDNEGRVELNIKNKGYEDALCMIDDKKATVIVKSANTLEEKDSIAIQEIVQNVSKIKDVVIQVQK